MISKSQAHKLVLEVVNADYSPLRRERTGGLVVLEAETIEKDYGWIVFYNTRKYVETADANFAQVPGGGVLVRKDDGTLHNLAGPWSLEESISYYEKKMRRSVMWKRLKRLLRL